MHGDRLPAPRPALSSAGGTRTRAWGPGCPVLEKQLLQTPVSADRRARSRRQRNSLQVRAGDAVSLPPRAPGAQACSPSRPWAQTPEGSSPGSSPGGGSLSWLETHWGTSRGCGPCLGASPGETLPGETSPGSPHLGRPHPGRGNLTSEETAPGGNLTGGPHLGSTSKEGSTLRGPHLGILAGVLRGLDCGKGLKSPSCGLRCRERRLGLGQASSWDH